MMYNKLVEDCFFYPRHVGSMQQSEPLVVCFKSNQQNQAMNIELFLQCNESGLIIKARFTSNGNPYVIAAMEYLCRRIEGLVLGNLPEITYQDLIKELEIPTSQYPFALCVMGVYKEVLVLMKKKLEGYES